MISFVGELVGTMILTLFGGGVVAGSLLKFCMADVPMYIGAQLSLKTVKGGR